MGTPYIVTVITNVGARSGTRTDCREHATRLALAQQLITNAQVCLQHDGRLLMRWQRMRGDLGNQWALVESNEAVSPDMLKARITHIRTHDRPGHASTSSENVAVDAAGLTRTFVQDGKRLPGSRNQLEDTRTAAEHMGNIRQVFGPNISQLAAALGVSQSTVHEWTREEHGARGTQLERLRCLSHAADAFRLVNLHEVPDVLSLKAFEGNSMLDLLASGSLSDEHVQKLIGQLSGHTGASGSTALTVSSWCSVLSGANPNIP